MYYSDLRFCDMLNGPGLRTTLFVSGCSNKCPGCFNKETWDPCFGKPFTDDVLKLILESLSQPWCSGLTLVGGDPLFVNNRSTVLYISKTVKELFPSKTIWMYTGYTVDEIREWNDRITNDILKYVDVICEGRFVESLKSPDKEWVGSSNQRVLNVYHDSNLIEFTPYNK